MEKVIRQGDVLLRQIKELPKDVKLETVEREEGGIVLAHGEVTGHKHQFREPDSQVQMLTAPMMANDNGQARRFLTVRGSAPVMLKHEEHTALAVAPGLYEVIRQREHTDAAEPRMVAD